MDNVYILIIRDEGIDTALFFKKKRKNHYLINWYKMHTNFFIGANQKQSDI